MCASFSYGIHHSCSLKQLCRNHGRWDWRISEKVWVCCLDCALYFPPRAIVIGRCWREIGVHWLTEAGSWRMAMWMHSKPRLDWAALLSFSHTLYSAIKSLFLSAQNKHVTGLHSTKERSSKKIKSVNDLAVSTRNVFLNFECKPKYQTALLCDILSLVLHWKKTLFVSKMFLQNTVNFTNKYKEMASCTYNKVWNFDVERLK